MYGHGALCKQIAADKYHTEYGQLGLQASVAIDRAGNSTGKLILFSIP
jgi:hypothetical protein